MLTRGVAPDTLLTQVRITMPFLFAGPPAEWLARAPHLEPLFRESRFESDYEYYELCLAAHHGTVSSYVPTDVDNQIRHKLWHPSLPVEIIVRLAELVLESRAWDYRPVSPRWVQSPASGKRLSGHAGEWLSTAVGAYGATRKRAPELASRVAGEIRDELALEASVFDDFVKARDGLNALRACTLIAHNMGDLGRVIEMWGLQNDPAMNFELETNRSITVACELNKVKMAPENHRHLALRKPRCLRQSVEFFLPLNPFLDDWGARLARHPLLAPEEVAEIVQALLEGLDRTPGSVGYTRSIAGIESAFRGGAQALQNLLPARDARKLKSGPLRALISQRREHFERQWGEFALQFCKVSRSSPST